MISSFLNLQLPKDVESLKNAVFLPKKPLEWESWDVPQGAGGALHWQKWMWALIPWGLRALEDEICC